jgi:oligoendopeptidase F
MSNLVDLFVDLKDTKWDLKDLSHSVKDWNRDVDDLAKLCHNLVSKYENKIRELSHDDLCVAILEYEDFSCKLAKLYSYAYLNYVSDMNSDVNKMMFNKMTSIYVAIKPKLSFWFVEINKRNDLNEVKNHEKLSEYFPYISNILRYQNHIMSKEMEKFASEKSETSFDAITHFFEEYTNKLKFSIDDESVNLDLALHKLLDSKEKNRQNAAQEISRVFEENIHVYTFIMNNIARDYDIDARYRNYPSSIGVRNVENQIEDCVVQTMLDAVKANYKHISHRYYSIKAKLLKTKQLKYYDRNAPLPFSNNKKYTFNDAKNIVLNGYKAFDQRAHDIVLEFFDKKWIDIAPRDGKISDAFCSPIGGACHPYVFINYHGSTRDVATLAHELGHGMHMQLSRKQKPLMTETPLTLSEMASVFGEEIIFRSILNDTETPQERLAIMCGKIEDVINTVVRQVAFCSFELEIHKARKNKALTTDEICDIWMSIQKESLGDSIDLPHEYRYWWCYISHFIRSPFYVYSYAFGQLLVLSLYNIYKKKTVKNFEDKYLNMLSMAGTLHHKELFEPFGIDISDKKFWSKGLNIITDMVDDIDILSDSIKV